MIQFRNIKTAGLIMLTMPLSIFGAALGLLIMGKPFSITALVGLISLMGIVVRNGIIYVSYAEELSENTGIRWKKLPSQRQNAGCDRYFLQRGGGSRCDTNDCKRFFVMEPAWFGYLLRTNFRVGAFADRSSGTLLFLPSKRF